MLKKSDVRGRARDGAHAVPIGAGRQGRDRDGDRATSKAMGADSLKTIEYSGNGYDFALGQAYNPSSPWPRFVNPTYKRVIDFQVPSSRVDRVRLQGEQPPRGGGQQPIRGEQPQTQTIIVGANTPWAQQLEIWMTPYGFLKAAAANNATMRAQTIGGQKYSVVTFTGQNKAKVNGYINSQNMVEKVETSIDDAFLGDVPFEAVYSDYKDFGGVKFPTRIVQNQSGYPIFDLRISDVKPNAPVTIQAAQGGGGWRRRCGGSGRGANGEARRGRLSRLGRIREPRRGLQALHRHHRRRPERGAIERGDRSGKEAGPEEADPVPGQHPPPHRPLARAAPLRCRRRDDRHAPDQRAVLRADVRGAEDAQPRRASEGEEGADVRDADDEEGDDRRQPRDRAASHVRATVTTRGSSSRICPSRSCSSRRTPTTRRRSPTRPCRCRSARTSRISSPRSIGSSSMSRPSSRFTCLPMDEKSRARN